MDFFSITTILYFTCYTEYVHIKRLKEKTKGKCNPYKTSQTHERPTPYTSVKNAEACDSKDPASPSTKCAYCDNLSLKQRFLSALISIVHEATYKIPNPNNTGIVQNKADTKLPGSVVQVFVDNPKTYYTTKIQLGTTSIDYSYDCTSGDIRIVAKNWDPFDLENADLGTGWHIRLLVQTWRNEIAKRMELAA